MRDGCETSREPCCSLHEGASHCLFEGEIMTDIEINIERMVTAMIKQKGDAFTVGYLESTLARIINQYVKDEIELQKLNIKFLTKACEYRIKADRNIEQF
jgi:hypothetical protein